MPRFFIDLHDPRGIVKDEEGAFFEHIEDALDEAKASARDMVQQYMDARTSLKQTCVEVRDVQGRTVASLSIAEVLDHPLHPAFQQSCAELPRSGNR